MMVEAGTLTNNAEVLRKAGANAVAAAKDEAFTNQYILEAEGYISATAKYDFVKNYSKLDTNSKRILREVASNLAAIYVIIYDMSGFTTRTEAENMINILWGRLERGMRSLLDDRSLNYITKGV